MRILAIDTALAAVSVCVADADAAVASERQLMDRGHAEALLPMIGRVVAEAGGFATLERIAVTVGPGSFTGIRVGIAAARALALAWGIPAVGVSTLAAFAAPLLAESKPAAIATAVDARHNQVYFQLLGPDGQVRVTPRAATVRAAVLALETDPVRLVGSGASMLAIECWSRSLPAEVAGELVVPDILSVALLGRLADPATSPPHPLYLKPPDAKPSTSGRIAQRAG